MLRLDDAVEATAGQREGKSPRDNAKDGGRNIGPEAHAEQPRRQIDQPKRKNRDEPQEQQIAEGILLKSLAKAGKPGARTRRQEIAERASGDEKYDRSADGRADDGGGPAQKPAEQEAPGDGE